MAGLLLVVLLGGLLEVCSGVSVNRGGYPSFTDEIPFKITWPGAEFSLVCSMNTFTVSTGRNVTVTMEAVECHLQSHLLSFKPDVIFQLTDVC